MLTQVTIENSFESWRNTARGLLSRDVAPCDVVWTAGEQGALFQDPVVRAGGGGDFRVSREFLKLASAVACFDDAEKWSLLYRILFRLQHETPNLLMIESDVDVRRARVIEKAIGRDVHKFHAFVRFRKLAGLDEEVYTAWHEPTHFTGTAKN
jgi:DNA polymerase